MHRAGVLLTEGWLAEEQPAFRDRILAMGRVIRVGRGQSLYATGDSPDAMFGVIQGQVDVSLPVAPEEEVLIHRGGPGFWVGDSALLAQVGRAMSVTAATECEVLRLPGPAIRAHLAEMPQDWPCFFRLNHRNAVLAIQVLAEVLTLSPRARCARTVLRIAGHDGVVPVTQEELARLTGMSRASVRRAMADLVRSGVIQTGYGEMRIVDEGRLREEAAL